MKTQFARRTLAAARDHGVIPALIAAEARRRGAKQKVWEFAALAAAGRRRRPRTVLEIGSLKGGTLWAWCRIANPAATIISVDLPGGAFGGGYLDTETPRLRGYAGRGQTLHLVRGDSHHPDTLRQVTQLLDGRPVDLLFIDGDHTFDGVRSDYDMYGPLTAPDAIVAFHDIVEHPKHPSGEVHRLWDQLPGRDVIDPHDRTWGGIGILTK
jgi:cephalosporin hydroxylase